MIPKGKHLQCTKDLINDIGTQDFTKGNIYIVLSDCNSKDNVTVRNDKNQKHILGNWSKYFKL